MENVALYCRVSTQEQNVNGDSLRMQQENLTQYAKKHNMNIYDTYIDGGFSATSLKRPELERLLNDIRKGYINRVLFIKIDRWSRGVKNYYKLQEVLDEHNCHWTTTMENYDTSTTQGKLYINIMLSIAENEANMTKDRINSVFKDKFTRGEVCSGSYPVGYKIVDKKLIIDTDKVDYIKDVFNYYEKTNNISKTQVYISNKYEYISFNATKRILSNSFYTGTHPKGYDNFCEPIISKEQFDNTKRLLEINIKEYKNKYDNVDYIFSGILKCKECKNTFAGNRRKRLYKGEYKDYIVYRCNKAYKKGGCTNTYSIPEKNKLEKYLVNNIQKELEHYIIDFKASISTKKDNSINNTRNNIKRKLNRLKDLYIDDLIDKDTYKKDYEDLNNKLLELEKNNMPLKHDLKPLEEFLQLDIISIYYTLKPTEKRRLWLSIIDYIEIGTNKDDITIHFL